MDLGTREEPRRRKPRNLKPDEVGLVNCVGCGMEMLGEKTRARLVHVPKENWPHTAVGLIGVWQRISERPYCRECTRDYFRGY